MSESITKEEAEKLLKINNDSNKGYCSTSVLDILFPPFEPKEGEVIAVRTTGGFWSFRTFVEKRKDVFVCFMDDRLTLSHWPVARPLTDKEKGL